MGRDKNKKHDRILKEVEDFMEVLYSRDGFGYINKDQKLEVKLLEVKKRNILSEKGKE